MNLAIYSAIVHDAATQPPPPNASLFSASTATDKGRITSTHVIYTSSTTLKEKKKPEPVQERHVRITIPTPTSATSALDVPHLLPAILRHQKQAVAQHHAHLPLPLLACGSTRGKATHGQTCHVQPELDAVRRKAAVALAYRQALLTTTSNTTAALMAQGFARHGATTMGEASPGYWVNHSDNTPHGLPRGSLLPSGGAPIQPRRCVVSLSTSASPRDEASPSVRGGTALRPPRWSASPSWEPAAVEARTTVDGLRACHEGVPPPIATSPAAVAADDIPLSWESPQRADPNSALARSPSSLRISTSPGRMWSPPSSDSAMLHHRGRTRTHVALADDMTDPRLPPPPSPCHVAGRAGETDVLTFEMTPSDRLRVDTTQPFLSFTRPAMQMPVEAAIITQPPSPTHATTRVSERELESAQLHPHGPRTAASLATQMHLLSRQLDLIGTADLFTPVRLRPRRHGEAGAADDDVQLECAEEEGEERESGVGVEQEACRTPSGSAHRPRPSLHVAMDEAARRHRRRQPRSEESEPQTPAHHAAASRSFVCAKQLPLPLRDDDPDLDYDRVRDDRVHYHIGRSASAAMTPPARGNASPPHLPQQEQRILAQQQQQHALKSLLATGHDVIARANFPPQTTTEAAICDHEGSSREGSGPGVRSGSWALRSLGSITLPLDGLHLESAPWRPTVNNSDNSAAHAQSPREAAAVWRRPATANGPTRHARRPVQLSSSPSPLNAAYLMTSSTDICADGDASLSSGEPSLSPVPVERDATSILRATPSRGRAASAVEASLSTIAMESVCAPVLGGIEFDRAYGVCSGEEEDDNEPARHVPAPVSVDVESHTWRCAMLSLMNSAPPHPVQPSSHAAMISAHAALSGEDLQEPVGMDEAGNVLYRSVLPSPPHGASHVPMSMTPVMCDTDHSEVSQHRAGVEKRIAVGRSVYCPMERGFADHGLGLPATPRRAAHLSADITSAMASPLPALSVSHQQEQQQQGLLSPQSLLRALAHVETAQQARPAHANHVGGGSSHAEACIDDDFTIRRSTVHDVFTQMLLSAETDTTVPRARLGGAPLHHHHRPRHDSPPAIDSQRTRRVTAAMSTEASPSRADSGDGGRAASASFLHERPSTREVAWLSVPATTTTTSRASPSWASPPDSLSREGSSSCVLPHPHRTPTRPSTDAGGDAAGRPSDSGSDFLARGSLALSTIEAQSLSCASLLSSASFEYYAARLSCGSARTGRQSWAPRKLAAPCVGVSGADSAARPSATSTLASAMVAGELRYSTSSFASSGARTSAEERQSGLAETGAFVGAANELAAGLRAYGQSHRQQHQQEQQTAPVMRTPAHARAWQSSCSNSNTASTDDAVAAASGQPRSHSNSRSPSLRSPSWSHAALTAAAPCVTTPRSPRPVVSCRASQSKSERESEEGMGAAMRAPDMPPWLSRLLRVQDQLQRLADAAVPATAHEEEEEDGEDLLEMPAVCAFEKMYKSRARPAQQPSPDALPADERAQSALFAASWLSGSGRDVSPRGLTQALDAAPRASSSRAHSLQTLSSTSASSIVAGRRAILLGSPPAGTSLDRDDETDCVSGKCESGVGSVRGLSPSLTGLTAPCIGRKDAVMSVEDAVDMVAEKWRHARFCDTRASTSTPPPHECTLQMTNASPIEDANPTVPHGVAASDVSMKSVSALEQQLAMMMMTHVYTSEDPKENEVPAAVAVTGWSPPQNDRVCPPAGVVRQGGSGLRDARLPLHPLP